MRRLGWVTIGAVVMLLGMTQLDGVEAKRAGADHADASHA